MAEDIQTNEQNFDAAFDEAVSPNEAAQQETQPETHDSEENAQNEPQGAENDGQPSSEYSEPQSSDEDLEELKRKAHGYESMLGRLKKEQQRAAELEQQLAGYRAPQQEQQPASIDDDIEAEIAQLPEEVQPLFRENSREGNRVRKLLEEYGQEHALSVADMIQSKRSLEAYQRQVQGDNVRRMKEEHDRILSEAFPEYADAFNGDTAKMQSLLQGVNTWINSLPYAQGVEMTRIVQGGTAREVVSMLNEYKKSSTAGKKAAVKNLALNNLAVPSRGGTPPAAQADINDYDAAFEEAVRQR